ncbi:ankyrin repeat-containing protein [Pyrus ussuriensis x Pyrus communis]|uniref:Ankyrin repeat-containing protein n=1 Tax=Pyrus ussuriensis x Pyrus communis TaxID=2448454 RepID=A0A5N5G525_9ROSA|nr:ankyrin repeat-containing protein [Pyrus ussuriensis x Pyrus communis]
MAATIVSNVIANLKVLSHDNYEDWSFHFKTYLLAEDLWEVVEETSEPPRREDGEAEFMVWRKNNAKVLHAIQTCCGDDTYFIIRCISSAKVAWDTLAEKLKPADQALENTGTCTHVLHVSYPKYCKTNGDFNEFSHHQPLIDAVAKGDWSSAEKYLTMHPDAIRERGSLSGSTALHMAVSMENEYMAKELVKLMTEEDLEIEDANGVTAIALATQIGPEVARCIIEKNKRLLCIPCNLLNMIPLIMACHSGHWGLARYLYSVTPLEDLTSTQDNCRTGADLISHCFSSKELDIALDLIQRCSNLTFATNSTGKTPLQELACMPSLFLSGTRLRFWQQWIYNSKSMSLPSPACLDTFMALLRGIVSNLCKLFGIDHMYKMKQIHVQSLEVLQGMCKMTEGLSLKQMQGSSVQTALFKAVEHGNDEFLRQLFTANILALGIYDENARGMFQFSIECRQEKVYNFFHDFIRVMNVRTESRVDKFNNTLLHSAARLSPPAQLKHIQCAALQMQRELQWFKEVEKIVPSKFLEVVNYTDDMTARDLFTKNHKELANECERSMKATATSCTVVAALIVTIMFIAVFSVPGGSKAGFPVFLNKRIFMVFIVADVFSLFSSTTSVVTFLGILNSRYAEDDFLKSLPTKMMIGLFTLFSSIVTMMIAFSSTLFLMLESKEWIVAPIILLASVPVVSFVWMQFSLLVEIFISTYGAGIFLINKKGKPWSFNSS